MRALATLFISVTFALTGTFTEKTSQTSTRIPIMKNLISLIPHSYCW